MDQVGPYESNLGKIYVYREGKEPVLFAEGFRAIFGMAWHDGALYVSHMPYPAVLRDTDGDGKADSRKDLFKDLGITNNKGLNDHIVSGHPVRDRQPPLHLDRRQGRPQGHRPRRQDRPGRRRRDPPLQARRDRDRGRLHRDPEPPRAQPRRPRQPLHLRQHRRRRRLVDPGHPPRRRRLLRLSLRLPRPPRPLPQPDRRVRRRLPLRRRGLQGRRLAREVPGPGRSGPSGASGKVSAFAFEPAGASFKVKDVIELAEPGDSGEFRPARRRPVLRRQDPLRRRLGHGLAGARRPRRSAGSTPSPTRARDPDPPPRARLRPDRRPRSSSSTTPRGTSGCGRSGALIEGRPRPPWPRSSRPWPTRRPTRWPSATWSGSSTGSPAARPRATAPLIAGPRVARRRRPGPGGPGPRRARGPGGRRAADRPRSRTPTRPSGSRRSSPSAGSATAEAVPRLLPILTDPDRYLAFSARQAAPADRRLDGGRLGPEVGRRRSSAPPILATLELVYDGDAVDAPPPGRDRARRPPKPSGPGPWPSWPPSTGRPRRGTASGGGPGPTQGKPPAKTIAWEATPAILETIEASLADPSAPVRLAAVAAVRETDDRDALPALRERFGAEPEPERPPRRSPWPWGAWATRTPCRSWSPPSATRQPAEAVRVGRASPASRRSAASRRSRP